MDAKKPTRQQILEDFRYWTEDMGADSGFQFERVIRRWQACGYPLAELPLLFQRKEQTH
jgi:hypothetical protein